MNKSKAYKYQLSGSHFKQKYQEFFEDTSYTFYMKDDVYYLASYQGDDLEKIGSLEDVEYMLDCEIESMKELEN